MSRPSRRPSSSTRREPETALVRGASVLDNWANADWTDGCQIDQLPALQPLSIITMNHLYEIIVIAGVEGRVRVRGGQFFPDWREVHLAGCSMGGSFLKLRGVYTGFCLEIHVGGEVIVTSPVQRLTLSSLEANRPH